MAPLPIGDNSTKVFTSMANVETEPSTVNSATNRLQLSLPGLRTNYL